MRVCLVDLHLGALVRLVRCVFRGSGLGTPCVRGLSISALETLPRCRRAS